MKHTALKNLIPIFAITLCMLLAGQKDGFCNFDVNFGQSFDNGIIGDSLIAQWLVSNGYYGNETDAKNFVDNGYLGHSPTDHDPNFWNFLISEDLLVVQEVSAFQNLNILGYYTQNGGSLNLTPIFSGTESGPKRIKADQDFGFYLSTPESNTWYTDRALNTQQTGSKLNAGGDAQSLIYELKPNKEWLIAWEDLDATSPNGDRDFNDMYLKVSVAPEPVSSALFVLGGGTLMAFRRRKYNAGLKTA